MKRFSRSFPVLIIAAAVVLFAGTGLFAEKASGTLILSTTTSTRDSGLLDYILPDFEKQTGIKVKVVAVGSGKALQMGKDGEADVLLVHAKKDEEAFVKDGHSLKRNDVMYNDFILVGPSPDPLKLNTAAKNDIAAALKLVSSKNRKFVSRGDDSGTHKKELALWKEAGVKNEGSWYVSAGKGMSEVLIMADEMQGYTLSDRATYLTTKNAGKLQMDIVVEKDKKLFNQYGVLAVNPAKNKNINALAAGKFIEWILSPATQKLIGTFGVSQYGQQLFIPNGK